MHLNFADLNSLVLLNCYSMKGCIAVLEIYFDFDFQKDCYHTISIVWITICVSILEETDMTNLSQSYSLKLKLIVQNQKNYSLFKQ